MSKTKVKIASFQGRNSDAYFAFRYNGEEVEKFTEFVYLMVLFHQTGSFLPAATRALHCGPRATMGTLEKKQMHKLVPLYSTL